MPGTDGEARAKPTPLRYGIAAGLLGRAASTLVNIVLVPLYLRTLGIESIGLIGFYTAVLSVLLIVDQVLGVMIMREAARSREVAAVRNEARDLLLTIEIIYLLCGVLIAVLATVFAHSIALGWFSSSTLDAGSIATCIIIAAWTIPLQLLMNLHTSTLMGLERQIEANILLVIFGVGRGLFSVAAILWIAPVVKVYFTSQLLVAFIAAALSVAAAWSRMPAGRRPRLDLSLLMKQWRFGSFLIANAVFFIVATQADKVIVSGLLPLSTFGFYVLAGTIAALPPMVVSPVLAALIPRFARLLQPQASADLTRLFHLSSQFVSAAVLPAWAIAFFFPDELAKIWTGSAETGEAVRVVLPLLFSAASLLALTTVPNALAVAAGRPDYPFYANLLAIVGFPVGYVLTYLYGAPGATAIWLLQSLLNVLLVPLLLHRLLLKGERGRWYFLDIATPLVTTIAIGLMARIFIPLSGSRLGALMELTAIWSVASIGALVSTPALRASTLEWGGRLRTVGQVRKRICPAGGD